MVIIIRHQVFTVDLLRPFIYNTNMLQILILVPTYIYIQTKQCIYK